MSVTPCLWFNGNAEDAVNYYVSLVPNSRIVAISRYGAASKSDPDKVLTIVFELDGNRYQALNGDMDFPFSEAVSLMIGVEDQAELDRIWNTIEADGGKPVACSWIRDRYGLFWQVVPKQLDKWLTRDQATTDRVMAEVMRMVKLDIPTLERAYAGEGVDA
jgi:predicted 3-demethylubiquinone-9 3-methyltransferase (glyoxalase superfamily)